LIPKIHRTIDYQEKSPFLADVWWQERMQLELTLWISFSRNIWKKSRNVKYFILKAHIL
jgi:hypothetical protein